MDTLTLDKTAGSADRRKSARVDAAYAFEGKRCSSQSTRFLEPKVYGMSKNISADGILFQTKEYCTVGDLIKLELKLSGWERYNPGFYKNDALSYSQPLVALGTVVHVKALFSGYYQVGVCLTGVDEGHRWALREFLKRKQK